MLNTLGTTTSRVEIREESYALVIGFPISGSNVIGDFAKNMMVKLNNDSTVSPVAAVTDRPLGRVVSSWDGNDNGTVRVAVPFEAHVKCEADGTLDEGGLAACSGFNAATGLPKFKAAVATNYASAIVLVGGLTTTTCEVGILRVPHLVA